LGSFSEIVRSAHRGDDEGELYGTRDEQEKNQPQED
jgi:hypothetical protein